MEYLDLSVLISTYINDDDHFLDEALHSIWTHQTKKPKQIVLVKDGKLNSKQEKIIEKWKKSIPDNFHVISQEKNMGLAYSLNNGLKHCKYNLIARMDADDISMPERLEEQFNYMNNNPKISISSAQIIEYSEDLSVIISRRLLPTAHKDIIYFAKFRSPISHPVAIFRKNAVLAEGGYPLHYPEDYALWAKMLVNGHEFGNIDKFLLKMRAGSNMFTRRGKRFLIGEISIYRYFLSNKFISKFEYLKIISFRSVLRLSPNFMKKFFYKKLR